MGGEHAAGDWAARGPGKPDCLVSRPCGCRPSRYSCHLPVPQGCQSRGSRFKTPPYPVELLSAGGNGRAILCMIARALLRRSVGLCPLLSLLFVGSVVCGVERLWGVWDCRASGLWVSGCGAVGCGVAPLRRSHGVP